VWNALVRSHEWMILTLFAGGGVAWGFLSLLLGFSWFFARSTDLLRVVLTALALPLHLAFWLGSTLQPSIVDPAGLVVATGLVLGLGLALAILVVVRWRER
jgi:hypothetical protein